MISEFGRALFFSILIEFIVVFLALILRDDRKKMTAVLGIGTLFVGLVGFGPTIIGYIFERIRVTDINIPLPITATQEPKPEFTQFSLQSQSELSSPETNLGLGPGLNTLLGVPFETGWKITTQCSSTSNMPTSASFNSNIRSPLNVFVLYQAGWALSEHNGAEMGNISIGFSDTRIITVPVVVGFNIRDWSRNKPGGLNTISSPLVQEAWQGIAPDGYIGGMDMLTIEIPSEYRQTNLTSIQINDTSREVIDDINPCFHLLAITVQYLD